MRLRFAFPVLLTALICVVFSGDAMAMLNPRIGRFMQRDPMGYVDGMNQNAYYAGMRGGIDPDGLEVVIVHPDPNSGRPIEDWEHKAAQEVEALYHRIKNLKDEKGEPTVASQILQACEDAEDVRIYIYAVKFPTENSTQTGVVRPGNGGRFDTKDDVVVSIMIRIHPTESAPPNEGEGWDGPTPEASLVHELAHAYQFMNFRKHESREINEQEASVLANEVLALAGKRLRKKYIREYLDGAGKVVESEYFIPQDKDPSYIIRDDDPYKPEIGNHDK